MQTSTIVNITQKTAPNFYDILKNEIKHIFGRSISTSKDCIDLADDIYNKTCFKVNPNTLRRFFGLVKAEYNPGKATIKILCAYCGHDSVEELLKYGKRNDEDTNIIKSSFLRYIYSMFRNLPVDAGNETFNSFLQVTINYLNQNTGVAELFQEAIFKARKGLDVYFEKFINIDHLNSYYGNGLMLYIKEARMPEQRTFAYSLLTLRYWLVDDHKMIAESFNKILHFDNKKNPAVSAWYYSAALLHSNVFNLSSKSILNQANAAHLFFKNACSPIEENFAFIFCRALILTGHFEHALYYIRYLEAIFDIPVNSKQCSPYQTLLLFKAIALSRTKKIKEAIDLFNKTKPGAFSFLTKKTDTVLYLTFSAYVGLTTTKCDNELNALTGTLKYTGLRKINSW